MDNPNIRPIAIYLPQFHPIPENDEWWGKGFTEWTNVTKAKTLFKGHRQPRLSADMGFYDLRLEETRIEQANLAKQYGLQGFAYYHYWFKGKQILERPINEVLHSGKPDFPFCLIWANETWSRRWLGEDKEILIKQEYSEQDDIAHAHYLSKLFADKRYITINGRPLFTIYRPNDLPNVTATINRIKEVVLKENGVEPFFVASNSHCVHENDKLLAFGFDGILNFRPQLGALPFVLHDGLSWRRFLYNVTKSKVASRRFKIYKYQEALQLMEKLEPASFDKIIPSVFVGWDNTARRGNNGIIIQQGTPELFEKELKRVVNKLSNAKDNLGLVFINAWNEWAEGNYLEPDSETGLQFIEKISKVIHE